MEDILSGLDAFERSLIYRVGIRADMHDFTPGRTAMGRTKSISLYSNPGRKMLAGRLPAVICGDVEVTFRTQGMPAEKIILKVE